MPPRTNHAGKLRWEDADEAIWRHVLQMGRGFVNGRVRGKIRRALMFDGGMMWM